MYFNEANAAVDAYRFAKAKKTIELLAPDNPPPGFKKPTEIMLGALLDTDQNLIELRRTRDAKLAILAVAKAELGGIESITHRLKNGGLEGVPVSR